MLKPVQHPFSLLVRACPSFIICQIFVEYQLIHAKGVGVHEF